MMPMIFLYGWVEFATSTHPYQEITNLTGNVMPSFFLAIEER